MGLNKQILSYLCNKQYKIINLTRAASSKVSVNLNKEVESMIENQEIKPRKHPGILKFGLGSLPENIVTAIIKCIGDYPVKTLVKDGQTLCKYIKSRHPPPEKDVYDRKLADINTELDNRYPVPDLHTMSAEEIENYNKKRENRIRKVLKERVYTWKPINYGKYEALQYAVCRSSQEYSILLKIFSEIVKRDPQFKPRSIFDFGSGVGSAMWASSSLWKKTIFEYFNVDCSRDMNDLSDLILRDGNENQEHNLRNVLYRQFLPASAANKYDLVVSAFSLFELSSSQQRQEVLQNLWHKCSNYMILIEEGTRAGFELIAEARDMILDLKDENEIGHVFSPCPHDYTCPRWMTDNRTPCNFEISFKRFPIGRSEQGSTALYSYVVLKKGRKVNDEESNWPRIVRPTLVRARHAICRMCTSKGNLQEVIFTASKQGKSAYWCARSSKWGDRLPITINEDPEIKE